MRVQESFYVARHQDGSYAKEGHETGMGKAIIRTMNVREAQLSSTPAGLMMWMGGHYKGTVCVPVVITTHIDISEPVSYPDEKAVWPE